MHNSTYMRSSNRQTDRSKEQNDGCQGMSGGGNWGVYLLGIKLQ